MKIKLILSFLVIVIVRFAVQSQPWTPKWGYEIDLDYPKWIRNELDDIHPIIDKNSNIYITFQDSLYTFSSKGTLLWAYKTEGDIIDQPSISKVGTIYLRTDKKIIHALNPEGHIKWTYKAPGKVKISPVIDNDGTSYFVCGSKTLLTINPEGTEKWKYKKGKIEYPPAVDQGSTIYLVQKNEVIALDKNGFEKWRYNTKNPIYQPPAVDMKSTVYIASGNMMYAINSDGSKKWTIEIDGKLEYTPVITKDENIYIILSKDTEGSSWKKYKMISLDSKGNQNWIHEGVRQKPVIDPTGTIYVKTYSLFKALDQNGIIKWFYEGEGYNIQLFCDMDNNPFICKNNYRPPRIYKVNNNYTAINMYNVYDSLLFKNHEPKKQTQTALEMLKQFLPEITNFKIQFSLLEQTIDTCVTLINHNEIDVNYITFENQIGHERELSFHEIVEEKPVLYIRPVNYIDNLDSTKPELIASALTILYEMARLKLNQITSLMRDSVSTAYLNLMEDFICLVYIKDLFGLNGLENLITRFVPKSDKKIMNMEHLREWRYTPRYNNFYETGKYLHKVYYIEEYPITDEQSWERVLSSFKDLGGKIRKNETNVVSFERTFSILSKIHKPYECKLLGKYYDNQNKQTYIEYGDFDRSNPIYKDLIQIITYNDKGDRKEIKGRLLFYSSNGNVVVSYRNHEYISKRKIIVKYLDSDKLDFSTARYVTTGEKVSTIEAFTTDGLEVVIDINSNSVMLINL